MRKILVIANREYQAAVRTKTFVIGLLMMPLLMGASIVLQWLFSGIADTEEKKFALIDRTGRTELIQQLLQRIDHYNRSAIFGDDGKQIKPRFAVESIAGTGLSTEDIDRQRFELSEKIRHGELLGLLEILTAEAKDKSPANLQVKLRYQSNRPTYMDFAKFAENVVGEQVRAELVKGAGLSPGQTQALLQPVRLDAKGLSRRDTATGQVEDSPEHVRFALLIVPAALMMLMFMVVLLGSTPLMQSVVEEKMQRIAEVLLGSVQPFQLMLGKLIGMTGVSLTISAVYLGGGLWAAHHFGMGDALAPDLLAWFVVLQALASLMFGSLFIAVGAACTDMKETQNLLWPVMILACLPVFLMGTVLRDPGNPVVRGLSFFPFATPSLMIARLAIPPGPPWWEPLLGITLVLAATLVCVWIAGRIFRIGILLQGKGARISEMVKWVFRG